MFPEQRGACAVACGPACRVRFPAFGIGESRIERKEYCEVIGLCRRHFAQRAPEPGDAVRRAAYSPSRSWDKLLWVMHRRWGLVKHTVRLANMSNALSV